MSRFRDVLDDALDQHSGGGPLELESDGNEATVEVVESGKLGVRVKRVHVRRSAGRPIEQTVQDLEDGLRALPERVVRSEVDVGLGGATLRTDPSDIDDGDFTQIDVRGDRDVELRRFRRTEGGREPTDFTVTRRQLGRLLDELG